MTNNELKFSGVDKSLEISLFEYGFICAPCALKEYFVLYDSGNGFHTCIVQPKDLNNLINGNDWMKEKDISSFLSFVGLTKEEWVDSNFENKLQDLVSYYGWENIVGSTWANGMTKEEVKKQYPQLS